MKKYIVWTCTMGEYSHGNWTMEDFFDQHSVADMSIQVAMDKKKKDYYRSSKDITYWHISEIELPEPAIADYSYQKEDEK